MRIVRVGSRESKLAVIQAQILMDSISGYDKTVRFELITMKTTGDMILDRTLDKIGGKGLFTKELERALSAGEIDLCVHSYKDMPMDINEELPIVALSAREDPRDALILPVGVQNLDYEKPIGSSSARRNIQLKKLFPGAKVEPVRGNVLTRLKKLDAGDFGGLTLACAGLNRLGLSHRINRIFSPDEILPAASQGILAVQGRRGENYDYLKNFHSMDSEHISNAERSFIAKLGGGCTSPSAAYACIKDIGRGHREIFLRGMYIDEVTGRIFEGAAEGPVNRAAIIGEELAIKLISESGGANES